MTTITRATEHDFESIVRIGRISVEETHRNSAPAKDLKKYIEDHYNDSAVKEELAEEKNIYHILNYQQAPVGFSKIILNAAYPQIDKKDVTKLDRIYFLREFHGLKLGQELLNFNIDIAKKSQQSGMWLLTWIGNERAIRFYQKNGFTIVGKDLFKLSEEHSNLQHLMYSGFAQ